MAYNPNEQFTDNLEGLGSGPRVEANSIQPKTFAAGSGTLAKLTPVMFNTATDEWEVWAADPATGTEGAIAGLVWPNEIVLDSDEEVLGNVMLSGRVHFDDIVLPDGESEDDLKEACRTDLRIRGILVQGLDGVR